MKREHLIYSTLAAILMSSSALAQDHNFVTLSTTKCRFLAMGGATTSISDDLAAIDVNPAAFDLYRLQKRHRLTLFLNPIAPITAAARNREITAGTHPWFVDSALGAGTVIKSVAFSTKQFTVALMVGEEIPDFGSRSHCARAFQLQEYVNNFSNSLVAKVRLAKQVSIGLATSLLHAKVGNDGDWGFGISYGILLQPDSGFDVGLVYHDLPKAMAAARIPFDRIEDETLNLGFSYLLFDKTTLSADIRNISEEQGNCAREVHLGCEQKFWKHLALRCGYYREQIDEADIYSGGVGLFDLNQIKKPDNAFANSDYAFEYTLVFKVDKANKSYWHFLSLVLRI